MVRLICVVMASIVLCGTAFADQQWTLDEDKLRLQVPTGWAMVLLDRDEAVATYDLYWKAYDVHTTLSVIHVDGKAIKKEGGLKKARAMFQELQEVERELGTNDELVPSTMEMKGCAGERVDLKEDDRVVRLELCIHPDQSRAYIWRIALNPWQKAKHDDILKALEGIVSQRAWLLDDTGLELDAEVDREALKAVFTQGAAEVQKCARGATGVAKMELSISAEGVLVGMKSLSNPMGNELALCIQDLATRWSFPKTEAGLKWVHEFTFSASP